MSRLLILACSATKRRFDGPRAAIAVYDGPAWRTLRSNLTCAIEPPLVLSAEHGLISVYQEIEAYDRRMTAARSRELIDPTAAKIAELGGIGSARGEIFFYGGALYRSTMQQAIQLAELELERDIPVTYSSGGIGDQLGQLKAWLRKDRR